MSGLEKDLSWATMACKVALTFFMRSWFRECSEGVWLESECDCARCDFPTLYSVN